MGKCPALGHGVRTERQIFPRPARPNSELSQQRFSFFFFSSVTKFAIGIFTYVAHFDRKVGIYVATELFQFASRKEPPAILAGPDGFLRPCLRHRVQSSYGDFLNSFAMKARTGPHGSYDNFTFCAFKIKLINGPILRHFVLLKRDNFYVQCPRISFQRITIAKKILVTHGCEKIWFYSHDVINRPYIRQSAWSYRREVWCNPAGDEICHSGLNSPIVSLHYLLIYHLDCFFSCVLMRVRAQLYFVRVRYLLI